MAKEELFKSYIDAAIVLIKQYNGKTPFADFLKKYFSFHKKYGSRDRKQIAHLCYCYFRLGKAAPLPPEEREIEDSAWMREKILAGLFFCSSESNDLLAVLKPEWNEIINLSLSEKLLFLNYQLSVFSWKGELSTGIEYENFCVSFFVQPDLFIRIRSGFREKVLEKLIQSGVAHDVVGNDCIQLPNSFKAEPLFNINKEVVIQDYSSQQTGRVIKDFISAALLRGTVRRRLSDRVWDCCAGGGGKSIMLYDLLPGIELTVSDIRENILLNLKKRFKEAGIKNYKSFTTDITNPAFHIEHSEYDLIVADVPCTGSGTWSRTPEQLYYFEDKKIDEYSMLQKKIVSNVIPALKKGGVFVYITCSVFKNENENAVEHISKTTSLKIENMQLLKGYDKKADSMFIAFLSKPL